MRIYLTNKKELHSISSNHKTHLAFITPELFQSQQESKQSSSTFFYIKKSIPSFPSNYPLNFA